MNSFITDLNYMDLMKVSGEDSEKFLQGQLTCDLSLLREGEGCRGAACNNKGRVYCSFYLLRLEDGYYLSMPQGVLPHAMATLEKYIPFYKAEMTDAGSLFNRIGLAGPEAQDVLKHHFSRLPGRNGSTREAGNLLINVSTTTPRYELWLSPGDDSAIAAAVRQALPGSGPRYWELQDLESGIFQVRAEDSGLYTPEELNFDLAGFVSFDKGCYTGQEIVARMHYRGKAGKRLFGVSLENGGPLRDPALHDISENTLGNISNLLYLKDKSIKGLVVLKSGTPTDGEFWVNGDTGKVPASVAPLDYTWATP